MSKTTQDFWVHTQITCRELINKSKYVLLTEEEALMSQQLNRLLASYFKLQRIIVDRDVNLIEKEIEDGQEDSEANN